MDMVFKKESEFEKALINLLAPSCGWETKILYHPTEKDLIENWKQILFNNNRESTRLGDYPLTDTEMNQILSKISENRTPFALNSFINGKSVTIIRDNPDDAKKVGYPVSLTIYDRLDIAAGKSFYQIAEQPHFSVRDSVYPERRGDVMLLINGMPVIHIELKRSGVPISDAWNQIEKYSNEGVFTGIFALVQIFVAMTPEDVVYFANPGTGGKFNKDFYFHWGNADNIPIKDWDTFTRALLKIPMAHQLIGFYTVADKSDGVLKVLRSYQYYAITKIDSVVTKNHWDEGNQRGGYIWHTTGSGKTLTSFKAATLISMTNNADVVVFLVDRTELDTQSLIQYKSFDTVESDIDGVENTDILVAALKERKLIVASIQKMYRIHEDGTRSRENDLNIIKQRRMVFIVDECHRDTFGEMMGKIKQTFTNALFFGFTGTPIIDSVSDDGSTTADVFGTELHRYTIGDGIRDKNVLGFDPYMIQTYRDEDIKEIVALKKANAKTVEEAFADEKKKAIYLDVMENIKMTDYVDEMGRPHKGAESILPTSQYETREHERAVVKHILSRYSVVSINKKYHSILATSSVEEAFRYYKLFKEEDPSLKTTVLVYPRDDNSTESIDYLESLAEVIRDYCERYGTRGFNTKNYDELMRKDISLRLAHKESYFGIANQPEKQLDLLIVVNQMLTGFDSKWISTLYLDKVLENQHLIQAISRTNRICDNDKRFGNIYYYRRPHTMKKNLETAVANYSGESAPIVFVNKLPENIRKINECFETIKKIFETAGIKGFMELPESEEACAKFAKEFNKLCGLLDMARVQDFRWDQAEYKTDDKKAIRVEITFEDYSALLQRYNDLSKPRAPGEPTPPYDLDPHITVTETEKINTEYMNSLFTRYITIRRTEKDIEVVKKALEEVSMSFAFLSKTDQKYANLFIHDVESGEVNPSPSMTMRDYITEYRHNAEDTKTRRLAEVFGFDMDKLKTVLAISGDNINEYGKYDELVSGTDIRLAVDYFSEKAGYRVKPKDAVRFRKELLNRFRIDKETEI